MPKFNKGILGMPSGKIGNQVFVHSAKYGPHIRKPPGRSNLSGLKENFFRTKILNQLASEINLIIASEAPEHKRSDFYIEIQKRLRKQSSNDRFALISTLKAMNIHPRYTIERLEGSHIIAVKARKTKITVNLVIDSHPSEFHKTNCYCFELLLLNWSKKKAVQPQIQYSDWIYYDKGKPEFEFSFTLSAAITHWLLCLRQRIGLDGEPASIRLQGMQFVEAGTTNKKEEMMFIKQLEKERNQPAATITKRIPIRVKPKKIINNKPRIVS